MRGRLDYGVDSGDEYGRLRMIISAEMIRSNLTQTSGRISELLSSFSPKVFSTGRLSSVVFM